MILVASAGLPNDCMILECVNIRFVTFAPFRPLGEDIACTSRDLKMTKLATSNGA